MFNVPEQYRIKFMPGHPLYSDRSYKNKGAFSIPLSNRSTAFCVASDGAGWEHVSVHMRVTGQGHKPGKDKMRTPTWAEMCKIKALFWGQDDCVVQYHPPESDYVNDQPYTLHLWKPVDIDVPRPPKELV